MSTRTARMIPFIHCGLAARDHDHAQSIIDAWLAQSPLADLIAWYEAPDEPSRV